MKKQYLKHSWAFVRPVLAKRENRAPADQHWGMPWCNHMHNFVVHWCCLAFIYFINTELDLGLFLRILLGPGSIILAVGLWNRSQRHWKIPWPFLLKQIFIYSFTVEDDGSFKQSGICWVLWYVIKICIARKFYSVGQSDITGAAVYAFKPFFQQQLNCLLLSIKEFVLQMRTVGENRHFTLQGK